METVAFAIVATATIVVIIWKPKKRSRSSILFATVATGPIIWKPGFSIQENFVRSIPPFLNITRFWNNFATVFQHYHFIYYLFTYYSNSFCTFAVLIISTSS